MSRQLMRRNYLLIPLVFAALTGCQDSVTPSMTGPHENLRPRFSAFPGTNGKLAFAGVGAGIHTSNPDGSDVQALTTDGAGPAWSADGTRMAFYSAVTGNNNIYVINADGSGRTQLTFYTGDIGVSFPSWSPDGSKIVFQNDFDHKIYVMDSDGSNLTALSSGPDFASTWSPDGTRIAFTSNRDAGQTEIYVMNANGTNQTRLTNDVSQDYDPTWSPDGSKIAFSHHGSSPGDLEEIYVMNANGTGVTNLTQTATSSEVTATWSPDGTKIAFIGDAGNNNEIFVINVNGTGRTNISNSAAFEFHLDWQPQSVTPPVCVFGPTIYTRGKGAPLRVTEQFTASPGSYIVDLDDLASSGADAIVKLNGVVIMEGRGTTGEVGPRHYTVPVTLTASNVLEIDVRGKKGSVLQVKICAATGSQCYPNLPAPVLELQSTTVDGGMVRFELNVTNSAQFPDALFAQAPDLAACGLNTSASRTWVDIYDGDGNLRYGFCALYDASSLNSIWFATPVAQWPAEAYITLHDRRCNITYTSNRINLAGIL